LPSKRYSLGPRILISGGLSGGGVQTHVRLLCGVLLESGVEVTVCATHSEWPSNAVAELQRSGVNVYLPRFGRMEALATWPLTMKHKYDVCYCVGHGRIHGLTKTFMRKTGVSIYHEILTCPLPRSIMSRSVPKMNFVIANSEAVGREMKARWPGISLRVIPFLTSSQRMPEPAPRLPVGQRELRVAYLSRLVSHKRPQRLVEDWRLITERPSLAPARLDIYGDDKQPDTLLRLRQIISEQKLDDYITCHGSYCHNQLAEILDKSDVVVLPSEWEGLPLVLVEAMQHGVPVVATDVGGTAELGDNNPDVIITGSKWEEFLDGLERMAKKLRAGHINAQRLHFWTERRYGFEVVARRWRDALLNSRSFFCGRSY
jgi:glycosyltransferase involved in cell wall biosynthesis